MSEREPHPEGIYFDMPFDEYLEDPSLGSGDIKRLGESPEAYWYGSPHNPDYVPTDKDAYRRGRAFHQLILEGQDSFDASYVVAPSRADYPGSIDTIDELKKICDEYGLTKSGTKATLIDRIRTETAWQGEIWTEIMARFADEAGGREHFPAKEYAMLEKVNAIIRANAAYVKALSDGHPEVSIFLRDPDSGIPIRCRVDWLAEDWFVDLKSFSNKTSKKINKAIANETVNYGYHVKIAMYQFIIEAARTFTDDQIHGADPKWIKEFREGKEHQGVLLFVGTDIPQVRARGLSRLTPPTPSSAGSPRMIWQTGHSLFRNALRTYAGCVEQFGLENPWNVMEPIIHFEDDGFPVWAMDQ